MEFRKKADIMDEAAMSRAVKRIAHEIIEHNKGVENLLLIGIQRRGVPLAERIGQLIEQAEGPVPVGTLDITFYRDDLSLLSEHPQLKGTDVPADVNGKNIVLIDDVLYTGPHGQSRDGSGDGHGPRQLDSAGGADRPRTSRTAHPRRLCRQKRAHLPAGDGARVREGIRRRGKRRALRPGGLKASLRLKQAASACFDRNQTFFRRMEL